MTTDKGWSFITVNSSQMLTTLIQADRNFRLVLVHDESFVGSERSDFVVLDLDISQTDRSSSFLFIIAERQISRRYTLESVISFTDLKSFTLNVATFWMP
jgi:hypothetical protein